MTGFQLVFLGAELRDRIDERLIIAFVGAGRGESGLSARLLGKAGRPNIGNPNLHWSQALPAQPFPVLGDPPTHR